MNVLRRIGSKRFISRLVVPHTRQTQVGQKVTASTSRSRNLSSLFDYDDGGSDLLLPPDKPSQLASTTPAAVIPTTDKRARMSLTYTEFDINGNIRGSGKYLKSDICAMHGLNTRDLRIIDSFRDQLPAILVRESAIVVNLEHIKALIKSDYFIIFDNVDSDNFYQSLFIFELQERLKSSANNGLPFELRVCEAILVSVCTVLKDNIHKISPKVSSLLRQLESNHIERENLLALLDMSKRLTRFEARVGSIHHAIMELLNADEDMAMMYLTAKKTTGKSQPRESHEEVEFMLEFYIKQIEEISMQTSQLISNISTTQTMIKITLDSQRNSLLILELKLTMGAFAMSTSSLIAGIFGMNLLSGLESHPLAFYATGLGIIGFSSSLFMLLIRRLRNVVKTN